MQASALPRAVAKVGRAPVSIITTRFRRKTFCRLTRLTGRARIAVVARLAILHQVQRMDATCVYFCAVVERARVAVVARYGCHAAAQALRVANVTECTSISVITGSCNRLGFGDAALRRALGQRATRESTSRFRARLRKVGVNYAHASRTDGLAHARRGYGFADAIEVGLALANRRACTGTAMASISGGARIAVIARRY